MHKITEELYIGSWKDVVNNVNTQNCLCVASDLQQEIQGVASELQKDIIKKIPVIGMVDGLGNNKNVLYDIIDGMEGIIQKQGKVIVFCVKGESRSALSILSFLHFRRGWSVPKAYKHLRLTRKEVKINPYLSLMFMELLNVKYF